MVNWLRQNMYAAGLLALARIYLGLQWLEAGWHKLTGSSPFDAGGFLKKAIATPVVDSGTKEVLYPNFTYFIEHFALPHVELFNRLIPVGEFCVGLGLILGVLTTAAAFFGTLMNFMFMMAGTVSTNPWLVLFGGILLIAGANAGKFGGDYYLLPYLRKAAGRLIHPENRGPKRKFF